MAADPLKYFRIEARELATSLEAGTIALERGPDPAEVAKLLRVAHTLKGAARVVKQSAVAEHAHAIEDILAPYRESASGVPRAALDQLLVRVDAVATLVKALDAPPPEPLPGARPSAPEAVRPLRMDPAELDSVLDGIAETTVRLRGVKGALGLLESIREAGDAATARGRTNLRDAGAASGNVEASFSAELRGLVDRAERALLSAVELAERELSDVRDSVERLRLVPASALFPALERTVFDVAGALGRAATFAVSGGDVRVDGAVLADLQGALVQLVRNAVAHGIESPNERAVAGKPREGRVSIQVVRAGHRVLFECTDDGRGIDAAAVASALGKKDATSAPPTNAELLRLLMKTGFSTAARVTEAAGRGIGLDVVRDVADRLSGDVTLSTELGRGTTFGVSVPVSLAAVDALLVDAAGVSAAIPLEAVRKTVRLASGDVVRSGDTRALVDGGQVIPFSPLAEAFRERAADRTEHRIAVFVEHHGVVAAIGVSSLRGTANLVVRPLPKLAPSHAIVGGAALDADGTPELVLDAAGLVTHVVEAARTAPAAPAKRASLPVLIVDDSLTTRILEQSILESAGYDVELATSAEEGLEMAARREHALFLVDVEMPKMDGFSFIEATKSDPKLRGTPAILVSSRNSPADFARGRSVGAQAYFVKTEFDQVKFLDTIRGLVDR